MQNTRTIHTSVGSNKVEIADLLISLFAIEVYQPSKEIWLISPFIGDVELLDNTAGRFAKVAPVFEWRMIKMSEILKFLYDNGTELRVVTKEKNERNQRFIRQMRMLLGNQFEKVMQFGFQTESNHRKGFLTDKFLLEGTMNFTYNGIFSNDEQIRLQTEESERKIFRFNVRKSFGAQFGIS